MPDFREQLEQCLPGRTCLLGLGNPDCGDDGFGVRLAETLIRAGVPGVFVAGVAPERVLGRIAVEPYDHVLFLDAVEFGGTPGAAIFLRASEMTARFPQISTHRISLGTLARWVEASGRTRAWLLGAQPASLGAGRDLSPAVQRTLELLADILNKVAAGSPAPSAGGDRALATS